MKIELQTAANITLIYQRGVVKTASCFIKTLQTSYEIFFSCSSLICQ